MSRKGILRLPDEAAAAALQAKLSRRAFPRVQQDELAGALSPAELAIAAEIGRPNADPEYWSRALADQIRREGLPAPLLEYPFAKHIGRKYRADLAYPDMRLAVEVWGAVHRIKGRFKADLERAQIIFELGWRVLPVSPAEVRSGRALQLVREALAGSPRAPALAR